MPQSTIELTNSLSGRIEPFEPLEEGRVRMYTCGPTVYKSAHIGNFRSYVFADTLRRMLEYNGYDVKHVSNITDVGHLTNETLGAGVDKIEAQARAEKMSPWDIAAHYIALYLHDAERLNMLPPTASPRATEYVDEMIALVERLIDAGFAYVA